MALDHLSEAIRKIWIPSDKCSTSFRSQIKKLITDDILTGVATTYIKQVFFGTPSGSRGTTVNAVSLYPPHLKGRASALFNENDNYKTCFPFFSLGVGSWA